MKTSVEENIRIFDATTDAFNAHDWDRLLKYNVESVLNYLPDFPEPVKGTAELREFFKALVITYPDLARKKERAFGQGDWICAEFTYTGTHKGPLLGPGGQTIPPTGKTVRLPICHAVKFEGGQITEAHSYYDRFGILTQLGLAP